MVQRVSSIFIRFSVLLTMIGHFTAQAELSFFMISEPSGFSLWFKKHFNNHNERGRDEGIKRQTRAVRVIVWLEGCKSVCAGSAYSL